MIPFFYVIAATIKIVLQADDLQEICVLQVWVECFDFFVECHHAALTSAAVKNENCSPDDRLHEEPVF